MKFSSSNKVISCTIFCFVVLVVNAGETPDKKYNAPEEIVELFAANNRTQYTPNSKLPVGVVGNGNKIFSEGSTINVTSHENESKHLKSTENPHAVAIVSEKNTTSRNVTHSAEKNETDIKMPQKLSEALDFISDISDLSHVNGTSSVKPRKGVSYSKIVPKKGVVFEDFLNYSLPSGQSCFFMKEDTCYDISTFKEFNCTCCKVSNELGILINRQPLINCSTCTPINTPNDFFQPCQGICCKNVTIEQTSHKNISNISNLDPISDIYKNKLVNKDGNGKSHIKTRKLKPTVTNVPYDSDHSNPFSKSKGEKYVPIIVSIFILPLAGVFIFLLWKKTRELWDRRYYKRMDFLIDGIYND